MDRGHSLAGDTFAAGPAAEVDVSNAGPYGWSAGTACPSSRNAHEATPDAGEAVVGSFVFGMPMIVEDGVLEIGRFIGDRTASLALTVLLGGVLIVGILYAGEFEQVVEDRIFGVVPLRPLAIVTIAGAMAVGLMTTWGRVTWSEPTVAGSQTLLVAIVMSVGAALGDILPER